jgi:hypothetical protein
MMDKFLSGYKRREGDNEAPDVKNAWSYASTLPVSSWNSA